MRGLEAHQSKFIAIVIEKDFTAAIIDRSGANPHPQKQSWMTRRSTMTHICQTPPRINTWIPM
jgi:hypothetical protein